MINVPNTSPENGPSEHLGHIVGGRKNIRIKDVVVFGEELFDKRKKGMVFENLVDKYGIRKTRAQRILKKGVQKHLFFAPRRIIHRVIIRRVGITV